MLEEVIESLSGRVVCLKKWLFNPSDFKIYVSKLDILTIDLPRNAWYQTKS